MTIQDAREIYNVLQWSDGYFDIDEQGDLLAFPDGKRDKPGISFSTLIQQIESEGLSLPVLVRFNDILKHRLDTMRAAFQNAMQATNYQGNYLGVYPIKVNQQRRVVETLLSHGQSQMGLEAGSKPELLAVLALSKSPNSTIVCNGYKDRKFIRLALIGEQLGHKVFIIIEKKSELTLALEEAEKLGVKPRLGIRVRLASIGKGKWQNTGGEKSKFGLSATEVLEVVAQLSATGKLSYLQLVHCHLGSQVANIHDIQRGMQECARYFTELHRLGAPIRYVDVGGGLGVDYEGTRSRNFCSMNYSLQEYANNVVRVLKEMCDKENLPHPQIITESGRALTAHHAMLILNIIDVERITIERPIAPVEKNEPVVIQDLWETFQTLSDKSLLETYHNACHFLSEAQAMYNHGVLNLKERARAEQIYLKICLTIRESLQTKYRAHREILDELNEKLADKLFVNFSLFQSLPDIWAFDQIFPIMPLTKLDEPSVSRAVLQDITCDSDGRIDYYVDGQGLQTTLSLPAFDLQKPYYLGVFLVGAYQEILGDMHNLFGDTDSVHVELDGKQGYRLTQPVRGDTVSNVLRYVHFSPEELVVSYQSQLTATSLSATQKQTYLEELEAGLEGYTYLEK